MALDDMALLREFAVNGSEPAFAELVTRHVSLVHSAAWRQVADAHLAEEITQAVFIILARKAASLGPDTILSAWLYRTTCYAAADALKLQRRRQRREQEAYMQASLSEPETAVAWEQLSPMLDEAMASLGEIDRAAVVLRHFENKTAAGERSGNSGCDNYTRKRNHEHDGLVKIKVWRNRSVWPVWRDCRRNDFVAFIRAGQFTFTGSLPGRDSTTVHAGHRPKTRALPVRGGH